MALNPGTRIGSYEVAAQIGAGGMGEVYRATDTRLKRQVAVKVLPAALANDPERLARFQREAEVLASLNHPHIAAIHGLEETDGLKALVMELVEGPTLADRIARGPIAVDEALALAKQIAEALEAAHEQGIIHRDLKPANIKVRDDGTVKVLDFGLAKALEPPAASSPGATMSPTITTPAMTQAGMILGTAAYMSPEQARGRAVDKRADLWAFGCVLYETLTGRRAFPGDDVSDTLASVLAREPDWSALPPNTPAPVSRLLRRCLERDRRRRLADVADARLEIEDALTGAGKDSTVAPVASSGRERVAWAMALTMTIVAALAIVAARRPTTAVQDLPPAVTFEISDANPNAYFAVSPDGSAVAYDARAAEGSRWVIRTLASGKSEPVPGVAVAGFPVVWSPDGRSLAFMADQKLKRIDVATGAVQTLADAPTPRGGSWGADGTILFAPGGNGPLFRIPAQGGTPEPVTVLQEPQASHRYPAFLPDGRHFLFWVLGPSGVRGVYLGSLGDQTITRLVEADGPAAFAPPDQVLFIREGVLYGQSLDVNGARMLGEPIPIASGFRTADTEPPRVAASHTGVMAFRTDPEIRRQIEWVDRNGARLQTIGPIVTNMNRGSLSPDGRTIALEREESSGRYFIWLMDVARGTLSRLGEGAAPVWSPDGSRLAVQSSQDGLVQIYLQRIDSSEPAEPLFRTSESQNVNDWSPDGRYVVFDSQNPATARDLWSVMVDGADRKPTAFLQTAASEGRGAFSPDGRWLAYRSDENGEFAVFVRPFPGPGRAWRVSTGGGVQPSWRADGRELYYLAEGQLQAVSVTPRGDGLDLGPPTALFSRARTILLSGRTDGRRFLVGRLTEDAPPSPLTVIVNWNRRAR